MPGINRQSRSEAVILVTSNRLASSPSLFQTAVVKWIQLYGSTSQETLLKVRQSLYSVQSSIVELENIACKVNPVSFVNHSILVFPLTFLCILLCHAMIILCIRYIFRHKL